MANPEHVAELRKGVDSWNRWVEIQQRDNFPFIADLREASFTNLQLCGANLRFAQLQNAHFINSQLQGTDLSGADLQGARLEFAQLNKAKLERADLRKTRIEYAQLQAANLFLANFTEAELSILSLSDDTSFQDTRFSNCLISIVQEFDQQVAISLLSLVGIDVQSVECPDQTTAVHVLSQGIVNNAQFVDPVFGRKVRDQAWLNKWLENIEQLKSKNRKKYLGMKAWAWFWRVSSDYGRSFGRWSVWSAFIVVLFALLYKFFPESLHYNHPDSVTRFTPLYFSSVIFTTLGFGDISPKTFWFEFWVTLEVLLGYLMLGGLISIFATFVARRND